MSRQRSRSICLAGRALGTLVALALACVSLSIAAAARADESGPAAETPDLTELSIQDLMNVEVTSAAKKAEKLSQTPAAIFVITQEDIRRSGVTSIAEALRMAPGIHVARLDGSKWAISARGFTDYLGNKLLVLIDGRTVYSPLFSGVYWDVQDTLLEDIDRIEVIRGPGGTLWGANAVNGVVNIITKTAKDTQGTLLTAAMGTEEQGLVGMRRGGLLGEDGHYRVYAKWFERDESAGGADERHMSRVGFRSDWQLGRRDSLTLQGDYYDGKSGLRFARPTLVPPFSETTEADANVSGGNVLLRWTRQCSADSDLALQLYYDRIDEDLVFLREQRDTFDLDFQHRFPLAERHEIFWGLGYRFTADDIGGSPVISFDPPGRADDILSAFIQDEMTLTEDRLRLVVGSKFEHNDYTGLEVQPTARLIWTPNERDAAWAAASRAVRTPSRAGRHVRVDVGAVEVPNVGTGLVSILGNPDLRSEELRAYELGYRTRVAEELFVDIAGFYNRYDDLRTVEPGEPFLELSPPPPHLVIPSYTANKMAGDAYGAEMAAQWQLLDWWRVDAAYSYLRVDLDLDEDSGDTTSAQAEGQSPRHQLSLRSMMDLPGDLEFDWWLRYVDSLDGLDLDSYVGLDLRLGWTPTEDLELSLVGQNLLESHDPQFGSPLIRIEPTRVERGVYASAKWWF